LWDCVHQCFPEEQHQKDFEGFLQRYAPSDIYLKYRVNNIIGQFWKLTDVVYQRLPIANIILKPLRFMYKRVLNRKVETEVGFTDINSVNNYNQFKWDGGFS